jgi:hypothetical protein
MRYLFLAATLAATSAWAQQPQGAAVGASIEALVTIVAVDKKARTVVIRGPRGNTQEVQVPKEAQNFDSIKQGDVFRLQYTEAVAIAVVPKGGEPSKGDAKDTVLAKKGANPGGATMRTRYVTGRIEAIDKTNRYVSIRGPKQTISLKAANDVNLDAVQPGDNITLAYIQAFAAEMVPQPKKEKPKAQKKG